MSSENRKITILVCDSNPFFLTSNKGHVRSHMDKTGLPYEVFSYPDGQPALDYLIGKNDVRDVILITGGYMMPFSGWDLLKTLHERKLLPEHCAVCSRVNFDVFSSVIRKCLPEERACKVDWLMRGVDKKELGAFLEKACGDIAASLEIAKRPPVETPGENVVRTPDLI